MAEYFPKFQIYVKITLKTSVLHEERLHMLSYLTDPALTYDYDVIDFHSLARIFTSRGATWGEVETCSLNGMTSIEARDCALPLHQSTRRDVRAEIRRTGLAFMG
jgi:hypothetical protein